MGPKKLTLTSIELIIGGVTVLLSTASYLLGSPQLALVALVVGAISFGIVVGARGRSEG